MDVFLNGQHCDETGQGRNTKVEFRCCGDQDGDDSDNSASKGSSSSASRAAKKKRSNARRAAVATLASIREPATCSYEAVVCTPLLCEASRHPNHGAGKGGGGGNVSALDLLEPLRGVCLARQEGWWGYEVCHGEQVRQFHVEAGIDAKGKATSRVAAEFVLGKVLA